MDRESIRRAIGPTLVILGVWTIVAMVSATTAYLDYRDMGRPMEWLGALLEQLPAWYMWALLTPFVVRLTRRHTIRRGHWLKPLAWHFLLSLIWMVVYSAFTVGYALLAFGIPEPMFPVVIRKILTFRFYIDYYIFWVIVAVAHALEYYRLYMDRARAAQQLQSRHEALQRQLAESQLQFLRAQLNPHFLFNTLNAVTTRIRQQENEAAITLLTGLSDLLRHALESESRTLLPLGEEREQIEFAGRIQKEGMSVRQTEAVVQETIRAADAEGLRVVGRDGTPYRPGRAPNEHIAALEQEFRTALGTKVKLTHTSRGRGKLVIHFTSHEEFERLRKHLCDPGQPKVQGQSV